MNKILIALVLIVGLSGKSLKTKADLGLKMVSPTGIEPVTISLKGRCSTYWATGPHKIPFKCLLRSNQIKSIKIKIFWISFKYANLKIRGVFMKSYLFSLFVFLILTSCSSVKEEIPVAGELICTAAGVEREECVKAAKIDKEDSSQSSQN